MSAENNKTFREFVAEKAITFGNFRPSVIVRTQQEADNANRALAEHQHKATVLQQMLKQGFFEGEVGQQAEALNRMIADARKEGHDMSHLATIYNEMVFGYKAELLGAKLGRTILKFVFSLRFFVWGLSGLFAAASELYWLIAIPVAYEGFVFWRRRKKASATQAAENASPEKAKDKTRLVS